MYFKRIRLAKSLKSRKSWCCILFFMTVAVGMNFSPLDSNFFWVSVNLVLERFFMNLLLFFVRDEVDRFPRSLRFLGFICFFVIFDCPFLFSLPVLVVLEYSVTRHVYFPTSLLFTTSFSVDSIVGTLSDSIPTHVR